MGKIALITGATSGIGWATAMALADKGVDLILCGRRQERLLALQQQLSSKVAVQISTFDVSKVDEVVRAMEQLPARWKEIDMLINNAGNAHGFAPFHEGVVSDWDAMIDSNVQGLLYVSRTIVPMMVARKGGHIVNISSIAGKQTYAGGTVYCASKKAVEAISEGMRLDLTQHGIKVTNIAPGAVETEFSLVRFKGDAERAKSVYNGFVPLRAEDVADAIVYALFAPDHVTVADITLYPKAQASPTAIWRK